ncbi:Protein of unknown function [Lactobacillus delbrueckii subsp. lactis]|nr:Protein of unknown function [Lactobacillus delbrueckii subsp. lactis]
MNVVLTLY